MHLRFHFKIPDPHQKVSYKAISYSDYLKNIFGDFMFEFTGSDSFINLSFAILICYEVFFFNYFTKLIYTITSGKLF